jgi:hypothetical protein
MADFSADMLDSPVNARQQLAVLKTLSKSFHWEIKSIYRDNPDLSQQGQQLHLTKNTKKIIFRVYRADLPYYFVTKIRSVEDERWRVFFTQRILVFYNHISMKGKKYMGLDSKMTKFIFKKTFFDRIPVVARSQPKKIMRMSTPLQCQRLQKKVRKFPARSQVVTELFARVPCPRQINEEVENSGTYRYFRTSTHTL